VVHVLPSERIPIVLLVIAAEVVRSHVHVVVVYSSFAALLVVLEGLLSSEPVELRLHALLAGLDLDVLVGRHDVDRHVLVVVARILLGLVGVGVREGALLAVARVHQVVAVRLVGGSLVVDERTLLSVDQVLLLVAPWLLSGLRILVRLQLPCLSIEVALIVGWLGLLELYAVQTVVNHWVLLQAIISFFTPT
jgi:hypothetical protein